jgi:hypothetical protein
MHFSEGAGFRCQSRPIGVQPGPPAPSRRAAHGPASLRPERPGRASPPPLRRGPLDPRPVRRPPMARAAPLARASLGRPGPQGQPQESLSSARRQIVAGQRLPGPLVPGPLGPERPPLLGRLPLGPAVQDSRHHARTHPDGTPLRPAPAGGKLHRGRLLRASEPAVVRPHVMRTRLRAALRTAAPLNALRIEPPLNAPLRIAGRGRRRAHRRDRTTSSGDRDGIQRVGRARPRDPLPVRLTVRTAVRPAVQAPVRRPRRRPART